MRPLLEKAGIEFPEEKRRRSFEHSPTIILATDGQRIAGYLEYLRSWDDSDYIYVSSIQIDKRYRNSGLILLLLDEFRSLVAGEEFVGFRTSVQKANRLAVRMYRKIGFTLEENPDNEASFRGRAGKELLEDSPIVPVIERWRRKARGATQADRPPASRDV